MKIQPSYSRVSPGDQSDQIKQNVFIDINPQHLKQNCHPAGNKQQPHGQFFSKIKRYKIIILIAIGLLPLLFLNALYYLRQANAQGHQQIFNKQHEGKDFGLEGQFLVSLEKNGLNESEIQKNTFSDGEEIFILLEEFLKKNVSLANYSKLEKKIQNTSHILYYFDFDKSLERSKSTGPADVKEQNKLSQYFAGLKEKYADSFVNLQYSLALQLIQNTPEVAGVEYQYLKTIYNFQMPEETRICILALDGGQRKSNNFTSFMSSFEELNYTNFHVVYIEEFVKGRRDSDLYSQLKQSGKRIKNRIKIVQNLQHLGILGSIYAWGKKYCESDDVVLVMNKESQLIGKQGLKILNSIYKQPFVWYSNSKLISVHEELKKQNHQTMKITNYESLSRVSSFRRKLFESVPLQSLIQYRYEKEKGLAWPVFVDASIENFGVFLQLEKISESKKYEIKEYFEFVKSDYQFWKCRQFFNDYELQLQKLKQPLLRANSLGEKSKLKQRNSSVEEQLNNLRQSLESLKNCQNSNEKEAKQRVSEQKKLNQDQKLLEDRNREQQKNKQELKKKEQEQRIANLKNKEQAQKLEEMRKKEQDRIKEQVQDLAEEKDLKQKTEKQALVNHKTIYKNVTDINQVYNFSQTGIVIQPTSTFQKREQLFFEEFNNETVTGDVTVVITTTYGRSKVFKQSLRSFFSANTYPVKKVIAIHDGVRYGALNKIIDQYKNVTWIITNQVIGQLAAIDVAYKFIETEYYFHTEDDWVYTQRGFIEYSLYILKAEPKTSGVWLFQPKDFTPSPGKKWQIVTFRETGIYPGFTLTPSIHRLSDYQQWPGGLSNLTYYSTIQMGAGISEMIISMIYIMKGYYHVHAARVFVEHIGGGSIRKKYNKDQQQDSPYFTKLTKVWADFDEWVKLKKQEDFLQKIANVTDITQLYDFKVEGTVISPSVPLKMDMQQTLFEDFKKVPAKGEVTTVFTTSGRSAFLKQSLKSFFIYNTYPVKKVIIVQDGPRYKELDNLIQTYKNITWVITNRPIGQLAAVDEAYKFIDTEYFFHTEDDWKFLNPGFIEYCLNVYTIEPNATHMLLYKPAKITFAEGRNWQIVTHTKSYYAGYSLSPSLHKFSDYKKMPGGFSNITYYSSFGKGAGIDQLLISMYFIMRGGYTVRLNQQFLVHIGGSNPTQNKYWKDLHPNSVVSKKLTNDWIEFDKWKKKNS